MPVMNAAVKIEILIPHRIAPPPLTLPQGSRQIPIMEANLLNQLRFSA
jgi:hypothetical protein